MVGIKRDIGLVFCSNFYRERLAILVLQINLLSDLYFLCSRKLCDRNGENCVRIRHSVSLLRHQMDVDFFADFHLCNGCIEAADHLPHTADELERFAAVVGRIKLGSIVEGSSVVGTAGFSDILTCMMVLDSYVELYKGGTVSLEEFAKMKYSRDILVRIIIKKDGRKAAYASQRRSKTDFPLIAVAAAKKDDMWSKAALVTRPVQTGCELSAQAEEAVSMFSFGDNLRGSADYRKSLAEIYVRRLMEQLSGEEA